MPAELRGARRGRPDDGPGGTRRLQEGHRGQALPRPPVPPRTGRADRRTALHRRRRPGGGFLRRAAGPCAGGRAGRRRPRSSRGFHRGHPGPPHPRRGDGGAPQREPPDRRARHEGHEPADEGEVPRSDRAGLGERQSRRRRNPRHRQADDRGRAVRSPSTGSTPPPTSCPPRNCRRSTRRSPTRTSSCGTGRSPRWPRTCRATCRSGGWRSRPRSGSRLATRSSRSRCGPCWTTTCGWSPSPARPAAARPCWPWPRPSPAGRRTARSCWPARSCRSPTATSGSCPATWAPSSTPTCSPCTTTSPSSARRWGRAPTTPNASR